MKKHGEAWTGLKSVSARQTRLPRSETITPSITRRWQWKPLFQLAASNKDGEDVDWSVFFNRALLNTFFFVSDYVLVHGIADILKESDVNVAHEKPLRDLARHPLRHRIRSIVSNGAYPSPGCSEREAVDIEALILKAINDKREKGGAPYASGKTLVVFLNAGSGRRWFPTRVAKQLPDPLHFAVVWVVVLHHVEAGEYVYSVTQLDVSDGDAPTWLIRIASDFDSWVIEQIQ
jgi:hypothetical protein